MKDFMYAATDRQAWLDFAVTQGFCQQAVDPDTEEISYVYLPGYTVDEIGPIIVTPPVYDYGQEPPVELQPGVVDDRHHVNVRCAVENEEVLRGLAYPPEGTGVVWVDPTTVTSPRRIFLGGMSYYETGVPRDES